MILAARQKEYIHHSGAMKNRNDKIWAMRTIEKPWVGFPKMRNYEHWNELIFITLSMTICLLTSFDRIHHPSC
jgi:hypothetical protein